MAITYDSGTNTITVTGYSETTPCAFEDIYQADVSGGWGKVSRQGDVQYLFSCKLQIGDGSTATYFEDENKQVTFDFAGSGVIISIKSNAHFTLGDAIDETIKTTQNGCSIILGNSMTATSEIIHSYSGATTYLYSSSFSSLAKKGYIWLEGGSDRFWNNILFPSAMLKFGNAELYNVQFHGLATRLENSQSTSMDFLTFIETDNFGLYFVSNGGTITNPRYIGASKVVTLYETSGDVYIINAVLENTDWEIYWVGTVPYTVYRQYTFNPIITDANGTPIANANIILKDKDGNVIIDNTTDRDGRILNGTEPYIVTYAFYNQTGGNTPYLQGPHHLTIAKAGYVTYETNITIDHKIEDDVFKINQIGSKIISKL